MRRLLLGCVLFSAFSMSISTSSYASPAQHEQLAIEVLHLSGGDLFFDQVEGAITQQAALHQLVSEDIILGTKYSEAAKEVFDANVSKKMVTNSIVKACDEQMLNKLLVWYRSPIGSKIIAAEASAKEEDYQVKVLQYLSVHEKKPPPQERIQLIKGIASETRLAERSYEVYKQAMLSFAVGFSKNSDRETAEAVKEYVNPEGTGVADELQKYALYTAFYLYRNLSEEEMQQYMRFMETKEYREFDSRLSAATEEAVTAMFSKFGEKMAEAAKAVQQDQEISDEE